MLDAYFTAMAWGNEREDHRKVERRKDFLVRQVELAKYFIRANIYRVRMDGFMSITSSSSRIETHHIFL